MKRKQIKSNQKSDNQMNTVDVASDDDNSDYTNEEMTSAITLASIMAKDKDIDSADKMNEKNAVIQTQTTDEMAFHRTEEPKRNSIESSTQTPTYEFPVQGSGATYATHSVPSNVYPYGSVYGSYPKDSQFAYSSYPQMYSMQPNFGPSVSIPPMAPNYGPMPQMVSNCGSTPMMSTNCRQCPFCLAPNASHPNTPYVSALQLANRSSRVTEPIAVHSVTVTPPQWSQYQNGVSSQNNQQNEERIDSPEVAKAVKELNTQSFV